MPINTYAFEALESTMGASFIPSPVPTAPDMVPEVVTVPTVAQIAFMPVTAQTEWNGVAVPVSPTKTNPVELS